MKSEVWLLMGLTGSSCGVLELNNSVLTFTADNFGALTSDQLQSLAGAIGNELLVKDLKKGKPVQIFSVPVSNIEKIIFPWYTFSGGMNVIIKSVKFRFSFLEPQNTSGGRMREIIENISKGRKLGKQWREVMKKEMDF